jgi:hypothetical protein
VTRNIAREPDAGLDQMTKILRSEWPLNVLVGSGWLAAIAAIGILLTRDAVPLDDASSKVAIMSVVVCGLGWLGARQGRPTKWPLR